MLGEDGTLTMFYQKFWHIVGNDVTSLVWQVLNGGWDALDIKKTLIVVIPKVKKILSCEWI